MSESSGRMGQSSLTHLTAALTGFERLCEKLWVERACVGQKFVRKRETYVRTERRGTHVFSLGPYRPYARRESSEARALHGDRGWRRVALTNIHTSSFSPTQ